MIDLFTTAKPFRGRTVLHQGNAFRSWRGCEAVGRITNFGAVSGELASLEENGVEVVEDIETTDNGLPSIRAMFEGAAERSEAEFLMFTNADMIYTPAFFEQAKRCCHAAGENFLIVGSRLDFDSEDELRFATPEEFEAFMRSAEQSGEMHPPGGSDYFIFPRRQYLENRLPDLWVGRGGWDIYMIYHAKKLGFPAVDLSPAAYGYHQNHDYKERGPEGRPDYHDDPEASYNLSLLPKGIAWRHWTLEGCTHEWNGEALQEKDVFVEGYGRKKDPVLQRCGHVLRPLRRFGKRCLQRARRVLRLFRRVLRPFDRAFRPLMWMARFLNHAFHPVKRALRPLKRAWKRRLRRRAKRKRISQLDEARRTLLDSALSKRPLLLTVGTDYTRFNGWACANFHLPNAWAWTRTVAGLKLHRVLADQAWQRLSPEEIDRALAQVFARLCPGGRLRIAVPDGNCPDSGRAGQNQATGSAADTGERQVHHTKESLEAALRKAGYEPEALEYWDAEGEFHHREWNAADGVVKQSFRFGRSKQGKSDGIFLIVDGVKPKRVSPSMTPHE